MEHLNMHRRQSRQLQLETALKFGIHEASRRHSTQRIEDNNPLNLPPLQSIRNKAAEKRNREFRSRVRAESIAVMRLHLYDENSDLSSTQSSVPNLPKIPNLKTRPPKELNSEPHWNLPNRRISKHNDKIIVEHLRHKLLRQHERRISEAYEDDLQMLNVDHRNSIISSRESYYEETIKSLRSMTSKPPSIMNFSSTTTSRMEGSLQSYSRRQSVFDAEDTIVMPTETHNEANNEIKEEIPPEIVTEFDSSKFLSRPSICVSYDSGVTDWINVNDNIVGDDTKSIKEFEPFLMKSKLQKSMNESERSVALLMRRVRRRSTLTEISEIEATNYDKNIPRLSRNSSKINLPVISTPTGRTSRSCRRMRSPETHFSPKELPIGDVSLFADWKDDSLNSVSRAGSFVSDVISFDIDVTATISRQNTFVSESYPRINNPFSVKNGEIDKDNAKNNKETTSLLSNSEEIINDSNNGILQICFGDLSPVCPSYRRKACIYVSSAGPDTVLERSYINDTVVPRVRQYCKERNLSFELIDLNLISSELAGESRRDITSYMFDDNHEIMSIRHEVIQNAMQESVGTSFVLFLGNTGGIATTLPSLLSTFVMNHILDMLKDEKEDLEMQILQLRSSINPNVDEDKHDSSSKDLNSLARSMIYLSSELARVERSRQSKSGSNQSGDNSEKQSNQSKRLILQLENKIQRLQEQECLLKKWYLLDTNHMPISYRLKPISFEYKWLSILSQTNTSPGDIEKGRRERQYWLETQKRLRNILVEFTNCSKTPQHLLDNEDTTKFTPQHLLDNEDTTKLNEAKIGSTNNVLKWRNILWKTPIECESTNVLNSPITNASETFFWFKRNIQDIYSQVDDVSIRHFLPMKSSENKIDENATNAIDNLKKDFQENFGYSNMREYSLRWNQVPFTSVLNSNNRPWINYLERLALDFYNVCTMQISNSSRSHQERNFFQEEILEDLKFAKTLSSFFMERRGIIQSIKSYLRSQRNRRPLILYGNYGTGKSTLLSKAAMSAADWFSSVPCRSLLDFDKSKMSSRILFRSIGVTSLSKEPRELLRSLCTQLQFIKKDLRNKETTSSDKIDNSTKNNEFANHMTDEYDHDFRAMSVKFYKLLSGCGTRECPLVVFLDNIGALNNHHNAHKLLWLPKRLPKHVKVVISITDISSNEIPKPKSPVPDSRTIGFPSDVCYRKGQMFTNLQTRYKSDLEGGHANFIFVPMLESDSRRKSLDVPQDSVSNVSIRLFFKEWLGKQEQSLTFDQTNLILDICEKCPCPLAATISVEISRRWTSSFGVEKCKSEMPTTGENILQFAHCLFMQLEKKHGRSFIAAISGYISISLNGVTCDELYCLLSEDKNIAKWISTIVEIDQRINPNYGRPVDKTPITRKNKTTDRRNIVQQPSVVNESSNTSCKKRVPMILFQKVMIDLRFLCFESLSDHLLTLKWKHEIYKKVAQSRYFANDEAVSYFHEVMTKFFSGNYSELNDNKPKKILRSQSFYKEITPQCCQPLSWKGKSKDPATHSNTEIGTQDYHGDVSKPVYNLRRLNETPFHYLKVGSLEVIKREIFFNYEWLLAKLRGTSFESLMENVSDALSQYNNDSDIRMLAETLHLSSSILKSDPCQLGPQIVGRLYDIIKRDKPLARMDPRRYPFCRFLIGQCRRSSIPVLTPSGTCLVSPGNVMFDLQQGHLDLITAVVMTTDGHRVITSSKDETLKVWDLMSRQVILTLRNSSRTVKSLVTCLGNNYVASLDKENTIKLWCLRTSSVVMTISETNDNLLMASAGEGQCTLVVFYNEAKMMKIWDVDKQRLLHRIDITPDDVILRNEQVITTGRSCRGNYILMAYISTDSAYVYNIKRGRISQKIKLQNDDDHTLITHVEVSREYYVIACKRQFMRLHEITNFELYDVINYGHVRTIKACPDDVIFELLINRLGSHIIALCKGSIGTEVGVWNVESGSHNHIASQKFHSNSGCCIDLQYCVTCSETESTIRVHNLAARVDDKTVSRTQVKKQMLGIGEFYPVTSNGRYVVARGMENGPITVWNITKGRCKGEAVSIERGLLEKNDVVVVKDVKVVVLTDRGISSVDEGSQQIFKTIIIYDLRTKKYSKKLTPVAITICPRHEYRILAMDKLMAISHDRTHFIVWSLSNGQVLSRIRPDFSKYEPKVITEKTKRQRLKRTKTIDLKMTKSLESSQTLTSSDRSRMIDQLLLSEDEGTLLCSFYSRHVAVFDMDTHTHIHTLIDKQSMLLLHQAQITTHGCHLVHTNYNEVTKTSYLTVWSLHQGILLRRLKNEPLVCGLAVSGTASKVVFATEDNYLKIWEPFKKGGHRKIPGYEGLRMRKSATGGQATSVFLTKSSTRAILFAHDISLWSIDDGYVIARFTPDIPFQCCTVAMDGNLIIAGLKDTPQVVTLRLMSRDCDASNYGRIGLKNDVTSASGVFGESEVLDSESSEDELI